MPVQTQQISRVKPPTFEFDDEIFEVDNSAEARGVWQDKCYVIYALEGRGKSTFLKSIQDAWGVGSIVAMDIERRLGQLGVGRITLPDMQNIDENDHYNYLFAWWDMVIDRAEKRAAPFSPEARIIAMDTLNTLYDKIHAADLVRHYTGTSVARDKWVYQFQWYNQLYDDILKRWRRMLRLTNKGYSLVFNAHVKPTKKKINGEEVDQYAPLLPPALTSIINREAHVIFYLQAAREPGNPNFFVTTPVNDSIPAKDQTGVFPARLWPTWAAVEACMLGKDWTGFKPRVKLAEKKEEKKDA